MTALTVPFLDMGARLRPIRDELVAACARIIDSGVFVMGPEAVALEEEFARFCGLEHAIAVSNGTAALQLALLAKNIGAGDEVITVSNTFIATVEAISAVGATPVLIDVEPGTYLMDASLLEAAITSRTKAIIPVHLYGLTCDMDAINAIARRHKLTVIEDACQAHGAAYNGTKSGALGDVACFSFYPSKNLGTIGEGGMVVTNDAALAARIRSLRSHGEVTRYYHSEPGWNLRLAEIPCAAVRIELRELSGWNERRRHVAAWYSDALAGLDVALPQEPAGRDHVYHLYVVQVAARDAVRPALADLGVGTGVHYPVPVHQQAAYRTLGMGDGSLPITEAMTPRLLSLPMFPEMTRGQVDHVAAALAKAIEATRELVA